LRVECARQMDRTRCPWRRHMPARPRPSTWPCRKSAGRAPAWRRLQLTPTWRVSRPTALCCLCAPLRPTAPARLLRGLPAPCAHSTES
ncbi:hypothetical protein HK405_012581, partial [Cladochytrium tenue]